MFLKRFFLIISLIFFSLNSFANEKDQIVVKLNSLNSKYYIDNNVDKKYNISPKLKTTEEVWNEFLEICNDNNIDVPKFPIWTDWWDSDGNNTTVTKYKK